MLHTNKTGQARHIFESAGGVTAAFASPAGGAAATAVVVVVVVGGSALSSLFCALWISCATRETQQQSSESKSRTVSSHNMEVV